MAQMERLIRIKCALAFVVKISRMDALRFDIVELPSGWLLTDGRRPPQAFLSSAEALAVAKAEAAAAADRTEIHLWKNGTPTRIYPPSVPPNSR